MSTTGIPRTKRRKGRAGEIIRSPDGRIIG